MAKWITEQFAARVVGTESPPKLRFEIPAADLPRHFANPRLTAVAFVLGEGDDAPGSYSPDRALMMQISRPKENALPQSSIGIVSPHKDVLDAWKATVKHLRAVTHAGVTAIDPRSGKTKRSPAFRFTDGARALAASGVKMLAFAGTVEYALDSGD